MDVAVLAPAVGALVSYLVTPRIIKLHYRKGLIGRDLHKPGKPLVAESGGVALAIALAASSPLLIASDIISLRDAAAFLAVSFYAFTVGLLDDLRRLDAKTKPLLTAVAATPIVVLGTHLRGPYLPFIGMTRLTIVYPFLIPLLVTVMANAVNMADTHNGVMPSTALFVSASMALAGLYAYHRDALGPESVLLPLVVAGILAGYYPYNRLPARILNGDSGSLLVGAALASAAIIGGLEIVLLVASMPYILNGFEIIFSVGGLREKSEMEARPVIVDPETGAMRANPDEKAPLTVVSLMAAEASITEADVVNAYIIVSAYSSLLALLTALLTF